MKRNVHSQTVKKNLAKNHACYVLVTCSESDDDGHMQVDMSYGGDVTLASYLIEGAQTLINEQVDEKMSELHAACYTHHSSK